MISSTTTHRMADIVRDTWPGLYRPTKYHYNSEKRNQVNESTTKTSSD